MLQGPVRSQVTLNRVPEKVPESQVRFNRICGHIYIIYIYILYITHGNPAVASQRFRKICKNGTLRLSGIPPKLIFNNSANKKNWVCCLHVLFDLNSDCSKFSLDVF